MIEHAQNSHHIDQSRKFFAGFSQGAILSMRLAIRYGSVLKGITALHGYIPHHVATEKSADLEAVYVFLTQGATDHMFSLAIGTANEVFFSDRTPLVSAHTYHHGLWVSETEKSGVLAWFGSFISISHSENTMMGIMIV